MGFLKGLFGGADGIRKAMSDSYHRHVILATEGRIPPPVTPDSPHIIDLYGALGTRYRARFRPISEVALWTELAPFLSMNEADAVEALAEYMVYKEMPDEARVEWLKDRVNVSLQTSDDDARKAAAAHGLMNKVAWSLLLDPTTISVIRKSVDKLEHE